MSRQRRAHGKQMSMIESFAAHDNAKACNNNTLGSRMTRCYTRNGRTWAHATEAFCCDRDNSIVTDLSSTEKKIKKNKKIK